MFLNYKTLPCTIHVYMMHPPLSDVDFNILYIFIFIFIYTFVADDLFSDPVDINDTIASEYITLPDPEISNLKDILELIKEAQSSGLEKEKLSTFITVEVRKKSFFGFSLILFCVTIAKNTPR